MDISSVVKPDVYRIVVVILVPGFVAAAPWLSGVFWQDLRLAKTWDDMLIPIGMTGFALCLITGLILENLGSELEVRVADKWVKKNFPNLDNWDDYLTLKTDGEFVGQRYLRVFLVRFKFELSMIPALLISAAGFTAALYLNQDLNYQKTLLLVLLMLSVCVWFRFSALESAYVMARTRALVISAVRTATP